VHSSSQRIYSLKWKEMQQEIKKEERDFSKLTKLVVGDFEVPQQPHGFAGIYDKSMDSTTNFFLSSSLSVSFTV